MTASGGRRCTFVPDRECDFEPDQISMDFCRVCVDAWRASGGSRGVDVARKLAELEGLFKEGKLEAEDYVRLRKTLVAGPAEAEEVGKGPPRRKGFHILLVERRLFSKKARAFPHGWRPPASITGKLVESLYSMCKTAGAATDVSVEVDDVDMACLGQRGETLALLVVEGGDIGAYRGLVQRLGAELAESDDWEGLLRAAASSQGG